MKKILFLIAVFSIFIFPPILLADPAITTVLLAAQGVGDSVTITGTGFGASGGYVKLCGLKITADTWSSTSIGFTIPNGAHSGNVIVVDSGGLQSNSYPYTVNYISDISSTWKTTDSAEFTVKDVGFYGAANLIESEEGWLYLYSIPTIATFDTTTTRPTLVSLAWTPSRAADIELYEDYIFVTGGFGLEIYDTADLQAGGFRAKDAPVTAGYTGVGVDSNDSTVRFKYIAINDFAGTPISGTLVALTEFSDTADDSRVFFFQWDASTETLTYLATLNSSNLNGSIVFAAGLWPNVTAPKLLVAECDKNYPQILASITCDVHEFNISNLSSISYVGAETLDSTKNVVQDLKIYNDRAWVALYGASSGSDRKGFIALDLSPSSTATETTYINTCSAILETETCSIDSDCSNYVSFNKTCVHGYCQTPCTTDLQCSLYGAVEGESQTCACIEGYCQICRTEHLGALDIIEGQGLVVGISGTSSDYRDRHNIFIFDADAGASDHYPLMSSESVDWAMDVTGEGNNIFVADEWTNTLKLTYQTSPDDYINHHVDPEWEEPTRVFSPGWYTSIPWVQNGYINSGQNSLQVADAYNLSNFSSWFNYNQENESPWQMVFGNAKDGADYVFGKSYYENFLVIDYGVFITVAWQNSLTGEVKYLNDPSDYTYTTTGCGYHSGESVWMEDNVVITAMSNYGIYGYYVVPDNIVPASSCTSDSDCTTNDSVCIGGQCQYATISERVIAQSGLDCKGSALAGGLSNSWDGIKKIDDDTIVVGNMWRTTGILPTQTPDDDWGGLYFFDVTYENDTPPTPDGDPNSEIYINASTPSFLNCTYGRGIKSIQVKEIGGETWILAVVESKVVIIFNYYPDYIMLVNYDDIATLNSTCLLPTDPSYDKATCDAQFESISIAYTQFDPDIYVGLDVDAVWWEKDGNPMVAAVSRRGEGTVSDSYKSGVYVFAPDDLANPGFDIDDIGEDNVYYIPAGYLPNKKNFPYQFPKFSDINTKLVPDPSTLLNLDNNDLLVVGTAGTIIRVGDPDVCGANWECEDNDECTSDICNSYACVNTVTKDTDEDGYIDENCSGGNDCDDTNSDVNPTALESISETGTCSDGLDNDCDGDVDGDDSGCDEVEAPKRILVITNMSD